jgi:hypothetical protein
LGRLLDQCYLKQTLDKINHTDSRFAAKSLSSSESEPLLAEKNFANIQEVYRVSNICPLSAAYNGKVIIEGKANFKPS